nr:uncharacterized protein LOC111501930 [Leptinotarsa decemlineata]
MARAPKYGRYKDIKYEESAKKQGLSVCTKHSQPCTNRSCSDEIILRDLEEKIRSGIFVIIHCPLYHQDNCKEVVEIPQIKDHIEKKHPTNIFYSNKLNREIGIHESTVDLLKADTEDFLVYIHEDHIYVGCLGPVGNYNNDQDIVEFDERLHCYKCKRGLCSSKHHLHSRDNPKTTDRDSLIINKNTIIELFGNPQKILLSVTLVDGDLQDLPEVTMTRSRVDREQILDRNSLVITRSLECIICLEYLVGDIYTCASGHLMCQQCKQNHRDCPLCKVRLGEAKCLLAKSFSKDIQLVCQTEGCNFIGNLERLALHEKNCPDLSGKPKDEKKIM